MFEVKMNICNVSPIKGATTLRIVVAAFTIATFVGLIATVANTRQDIFTDFDPNEVHDGATIVTKNGHDSRQSTDSVGHIKWTAGDLYNENKQHPLSVLDIDPLRLAPITHEAQEFIFNWQFRSKKKCSTANFLQPREHPAGIGSIVHVLGAWLAVAIENDRILLAPSGPLQYLSGNPYCSNFWGCMYQDVTNCSAFATPDNTISEFDANLMWTIPTSLTKLLLASRPDLESQAYSVKYWWRAQSTAFLMRPAAAALKIISEMRMSDNTHPWPLGSGIIFVFIRRGDKYREMILPPLDVYLSAADNIAASHPLYLKRTMMIASDSHKDILEFNQSLPAGWTTMVLDMPRTDDVDGGANKDINAGISGRLGGDIVHRHLLQIFVALEADAWVCTLESNMCRIIDELRCTWTPKCENPYIDAGVGDTWKQYEW